MKRRFPHSKQLASTLQPMRNPSESRPPHRPHRPPRPVWCLSGTCGAGRRSIRRPARHGWRYGWRRWHGKRRGWREWHGRRRWHGRYGNARRRPRSTYRATGRGWRSAGLRRDVRPGARRRLCARTPEQAGKKAGKYWALQGLRSLNINLDESGNEVVFRSLGADPTLDVRVFHQGRMQWFAWAVAALVLMLGLLIARVSLKRRFQFVALVTLLACGLPLLGGPLTEFSSACEKALFAVIALIPIWILIAFSTTLGRGLRGLSRRAVALVGGAAAILVLSGLVCQPSPAAAQDLIELLKPLLEADDPVQLPEDAIVIPYDPTIPRAVAAQRRSWFPTAATSSCGIWPIRNERLMASRNSTVIRWPERAITLSSMKAMTLFSRAMSTSSCLPISPSKCPWRWDKP